MKKHSRVRNSTSEIFCNIKNKEAAEYNCQKRDSLTPREGRAKDVKNSRDWEKKSLFF